MTFEDRDRKESRTFLPLETVAAVIVSLPGWRRRFFTGRSRPFGFLRRAASLLPRLDAPSRARLKAMVHSVRRLNEIARSILEPKLVVSSFFCPRHSSIPCSLLLYDYEVLRWQNSALQSGTGYS